MSEKTKQLIHTVYGIVLGVLILAVGVAFVLSCLDIYHSGDRPFSRDAVGAHFRAISIPVYTTLAAILGGALLSVALPEERRKPKAMRDDAVTLARLKTKTAVASKEPMRRRILRIVTAILVLLLSIYPLCYFADVSHFGIKELNADVQRAVVIVLVATAIALALTAICACLCAASVRREIAQYKQALAEQGPTVQSASASEDTFFTRHKPLILTAVRAVVFAVAVLFIVLGIVNGGILDVLGKAIRICTECIGLG